MEVGVEPFPVALFPDPGLLDVGHLEALLNGAVVGHDAHGAPAGLDLGWKASYPCAHKYTGQVDNLR